MTSENISSTQKLTKEQAIILYNSGWWKEKTPEEIVKFQLFEPRLCMPFSEFHKAIEIVLNRPVFTHEFGSRGRLKEEYLGEKPAPTFDEIMAIIPEEKRVLVFI